MVKNRLLNLGLFGAIVGIFALGCGNTGQTPSLLASLQDSPGGTVSNGSNNQGVNDNQNGGSVNNGDDGATDDGDDGETDTALRAMLPTNAVFAEVKYEEGTDGKSFEVRVHGGQPGAALEVTVGGAAVTTLTLDAFGAGNIDLDSAPEGKDEQPLPENFPTLSVGTVVTVGSMTAELQIEVDEDAAEVGNDEGKDEGAEDADEAGDEDAGGDDAQGDDENSDDGDPEDPNALVLEAELSTASFRAEVVVTDEGDKLSLEIDVVGGPAGQTVDLTIGGQTISVLLDASGSTEIELSSAPEDVDEGQLPASFSFPATGDQATFGGLAGAFVIDEDQEKD